MNNHKRAISQVETRKKKDQATESSLPKHVDAGMNNKGSIPRELKTKKANFRLMQMLKPLLALIRIDQNFVSGLVVFAMRTLQVWFPAH